MDGMDYCEECEREHREEVKELMEQLKAKTQECEELLKENQQLRNSLSDSLMFKFTGQENETNRYRKALEEIEGYIKDPCEYCKPTSKCRECLGEGVLNIISKAKGEINE